MQSLIFLRCRRDDLPRRGRGSSDASCRVAVMAACDRTWLGGALDLVDRVMLSTWTLLTPGRRLFDNGVGDLEMLDAAEEDVRKIYVGEMPLPCVTDLRWAPASTKNGIIVEEATFDAPLAQYLPKESARAHFQFVRPVKVDDLKGIAIHSQMTADETFAWRRYPRLSSFCTQQSSHDSSTQEHGRRGAGAFWNCVHSTDGPIVYLRGAIRMDCTVIN